MEKKQGNSAKITSFHLLNVETLETTFLFVYAPCFSTSALATERNIMAIESPLFQSSLELLGHSFSHFNGSKELDRKLVILHLANSVELLLKDIVLDLGESIYKSPKETITIHGCIKTVQENTIKIPFLNKIELLIDERNALQHRFGSPNELTTIFYMNIAQEFFKEILKEHYDLEYNEIIMQFVEEKELESYNMREPSNDTELENLKKLSKVHPLGALLSAMTYLEKIIIQLSENIGLDNEIRRRPLYMISHRILERYGISIEKQLSDKLDESRRLRNMIAHGRKDATKSDVEKAIEAIEEFEKFIANIDLDKTKQDVITIIEEENKNREKPNKLF